MKYKLICFPVKVMEEMTLQDIVHSMQHIQSCPITHQRFCL